MQGPANEGEDLNQQQDARREDVNDQVNAPIINNAAGGEGGAGGAGGGGGGGGGQGQAQAQDEVNWNLMEWDRAEELTWERLLGLDGSLVFLEHVFWVASLNTLFILVFGKS